MSSTQEAKTPKPPPPPAPTIDPDSTEGFATPINEEDHPSTFPTKLTKFHTTTQPTNLPTNLTGSGDVIISSQSTTATTTTATASQDISTSYSSITLSQQLATPVIPNQRKVHIVLPPTNDFLPDDICLKIAAYCHPATLPSLRCVSKLWKTLLDDPISTAHIWARAYQTEWQSILNRNSSQSWRQAFLSRYQGPYSRWEYPREYPVTSCAFMGAKRGHGGTVTCVQLGPGFVISGGDDGSLFGWKMGDTPSWRNPSLLCGIDGEMERDDGWETSTGRSEGGRTGERSGGSEKGCGSGSEKGVGGGASVKSGGGGVGGINSSGLVVGGGGIRVVSNSAVANQVLLGAVSGSLLERPSKLAIFSDDSKIIPAMNAEISGMSSSSSSVNKIASTMKRSDPVAVEKRSNASPRASVVTANTMRSVLPDTSAQSHSMAKNRTSSPKPSLGTSMAESLGASMIGSTMSSSVLGNIVSTNVTNLINNISLSESAKTNVGKILETASGNTNPSANKTAMKNIASNNTPSTSTTHSPKGTSAIAMKLPDADPSKLDTMKPEFEFRPLSRSNSLEGLEDIFGEQYNEKGVRNSAVISTKSNSLVTTRTSPRSGSPFSYREGLAELRREGGQSVGQGDKGVESTSQTSASQPPPPPRPQVPQVATTSSPRTFNMHQYANNAFSSGAMNSTGSWGVYYSYASSSAQNNANPNPSTNAQQPQQQQTSSNSTVALSQTNPTGSAAQQQQQTKTLTHQNLIQHHKSYKWITKNVQYSGHSGPVWCLKYDLPRKKLFSGGYDSTLKIWNLENGKCEDTLRVMNSDSWVTSLDVLPVEDFLVSGQSDGSLRLWSINTARVNADAVDVGFDNPRAGVRNNDNNANNNPQNPRNNNNDNAQNVQQQVHGPIAAIHPNLLVNNNNFALGQLLGQTQHPGNVHSVAVIKGNIVLSSHAGMSSLLEWDLIAQKFFKKFSNGHSDDIYSIHQDSSYFSQTFVTGSKDKTACLWDSRCGGGCEAKLGMSMSLGKKASVVSRLWNSGGIVMDSSAGQNSCVTTEEKTAQTSTQNSQQSSNTSHNAAVLDAKIRGCRVLTASMDKTLKLWDVRKYDIPLVVLYGHSAPVHSCDFSDEFVASGSVDTSLRIWTTAEG